MANAAIQNDLTLDLDESVKRFHDPVWGARKLKEITLFQRFTDDELTMLYSLGQLITKKKNAHVVVEGEPTRGMYILLHGRVSVYKSDPITNSLVRLAILEEGANFGELSLFHSAPRTATVAAETTCYLFEMEAESFDKFLQECGDDLQVRFFRQCAEELAERFRTLNSDYINSQQLLWKHALRRANDS